MRAKHNRGTTVLRTRPGAAARTAKEIVYPESDGKPMAETGIHVAAIIRLILLLQAWYRANLNVNVNGNQFLYYQRGNRKAVIAPDVYVAKGVPQDPPLDTYKLWELGVPPAVVIEVTSKSSRNEDRRKKRAIYAAIGVPEYILYDPRAEWLQPPLQGYRLDAEGYEPMIEAPEGGLLSEELGLRLVLEDGQVQLYDRQTGARLLTSTEQAEAEAVRAEAEAARAETEAARAEAEAKRAETEAARAETEAARAEAETKRAETEAARAEAETKRAETEAARADTADEGRRAAEVRVAELEALLQEQQPPAS
ncbi:MAG: Uma2 family endonuclease [Dehalococcoidia bacterium]